MYDYFLRIPEMDITESQRRRIYEYYKSLPTVDKVYDCNNNFKKINYNYDIHNLQNKLKVENRYCFVYQKPGVKINRHRDLEENNRNTVITIPITARIGTNWYDDSERLVAVSDYSKGSYIINVRKLHDVHNTEKHERVMLQFMIDDSFDNVVKKYNEGLLCHTLSL